MLEKTTTVLSLDTRTRVLAWQVPFVHGGTDEDTRTHEFLMDMNVWGEMGNPECITVTIEKGDKLNA